MHKSVEYSVGSDDGCSIRFQKEEADFSGTVVTLKFRHIFLVGTMIAGITFAWKFQGSNTQVEENYPPIVVETIPEHVTNEKSPLISDQGFIFEDSDIRIITREEVLALQDEESYSFKKLLRMSVNEIYARHGQVFRSGEFYDQHYRQYDWYNVTQKHIVEWKEFNETEKSSLRTLLEVEKEYGYRK